jgi:hypothetical protein
MARVGTMTSIEETLYRVCDFVLFLTSTVFVGLYLQGGQGYY